jgi:hypothetical protein
MSRIGRALTLGLCNVLLGCSGDDHGTPQFHGFPRDQTCGLRVELAGDITASATGDAAEFTCLTGLGPETDGFLVAFEPAQPSAMRIFQLRVSSAKAGAAGNDLPATFASASAFACRVCPGP